VVTASGTDLTVNQYQNADLFWALRGGGGGTYALVISATYKTYDPVQLSVMNFKANFTTLDDARSTLAELIRIFPSLTDRGWFAYTTFVSQQPSIEFGLDAIGATESELNVTMKNFLDRARHVADGDVIANTFHFDTYFRWLAPTIAPTETPGRSAAIGSRLLSYDLATADPSRVANVISTVDSPVIILCVLCRKFLYHTLMIFL
jgi:hypothetical protein